MEVGNFLLLGLVLLVEPDGLLLDRIAAAFLRLNRLVVLGCCAALLQQLRNIGGFRRQGLINRDVIPRGFESLCFGLARGDLLGVGFVARLQVVHVRVHRNQTPQLLELLLRFHPHELQRIKAQAPRDTFQPVVRCFDESVAGLHFDLESSALVVQVAGDDVAIGLDADKTLLLSLPDEGWGEGLAA